MKEIKLEYKGRTLKFRRVDGWSNLSRRQYLLWCGILRMELHVDEALDLATRLFYNISGKWWKLLNAAHRYELRQKLDFLLSAQATDNILDSFRIGFMKYYGPAHKLSNLTIAEYRQTELYYDMYLHTGQTKFLHLLAATLFRPKGKRRGDDIRLPLDDYTVGKRANLFRWTLHPVKLLAIKFYYESCRTYVRKSFPTIYKTSAPSDGPFTRPNTGLQDLEDHILAYSGDKFGSFDHTRNTNLYLFLKHMAERIDEYERAMAARQ
ncbi:MULTISPECIES: hypothetical protein [Sphingobacterium]|uniref:Integrase n=1 Tax=Sphingobacterium populi TaxID=1812824 RepID=A0ABW5U805_9SPHI|nr:hypothetical protein [Sphingobacterium sp. CFCC 11742]